MQVQYVDTHTHLDMLADKGVDPEEAVDRARKAGVATMVAIAGSGTPGRFDTTLRLAEAHGGVYAAVGVHPHEARHFCDEHARAMERAAACAKVVALGEMGLDYYYHHSPKDAQRRAFTAQLRTARELGLPVVVHTREADADTAAILDGEGAGEIGGVIHCFSSSGQLAETALRLGFYISFSGIVTFPNARAVADVARWVPLDRLLVETDAPFLSPVPYRGRVNEPARVEHVVAHIARLRDLPVAAVAHAVWENAARCFPKLAVGR